MSSDVKDLVPVNQHNDGFNDSDDDVGSLIRGTMLKFNNAYEWLTKGEEELIPPDREFIVGEVIRVFQKWPVDGGKPETRILKPDEKFPDIETMNKKAPKSELRDKFGKMEGPYENAYYGYLFDPKTMESFTFPTATKGGHKCFKVLKEDTRTARLVKGPHAYPLVTLTDAWFTDNYGGKQRPHFKIKDWLVLVPHNAAPAVPDQVAPQIAAEPAKANAEAPKANADMDDDILF